MQRVFGASLRLPRSVCSDDMVDAELLAMEGKTDFQRAHEMRVAAMKAFIEADHVEEEWQQWEDWQHWQSQREHQWDFWQEQEWGELVEASTLG